MGGTAKTDWADPIDTYLWDTMWDTHLIHKAEAWHTMSCTLALTPWNKTPPPWWHFVGPITPMVAFLL